MYTCPFIRTDGSKRMGSENCFGRFLGIKATGSIHKSWRVPYRKRIIHHIVFNYRYCMYHDSQRLLNFKWPKTATSLAEDEWIEYANRPPPFFVAEVYRDVRHVYESRLQLHVLVFVHEPQDFRVRRERNHLRGCCSDCSVVHYWAVFLIFIVVILRLLGLQWTLNGGCGWWLQIEGEGAIQLAGDEAFEQRRRRIAHQLRKLCQRLLPDLFPFHLGKQSKRL